MRVVALIILALVSSKTDVTTSSYEDIYVCTKDAHHCTDHFRCHFGSSLKAKPISRPLSVSTAP